MLRGLQYAELLEIADIICLCEVGHVQEILPSRCCSGKAALRRAIKDVLNRMSVLACTHIKSGVVLLLDAHNVQLSASLYYFFDVTDNTKCPSNNAAENGIAAAVSVATTAPAEALVGDGGRGGADQEEVVVVGDGDGGANQEEVAGGG
jgi:hypothetical protein